MSACLGARHCGGSAHSPAARSRSARAGVSGWKCEKSKRSRSGATSEPFCCTCVPSTCAAPRAAGGWRNDSARWPARRARVHLRATSHRPRGCRPARPAGPGARAPRRASACRSTTKRAAAAPQQLAGIADLAARLGVERRAIEHHLALLAVAQLLDAAAPSLEQRDAPAPGIQPPRSRGTRCARRPAPARMIRLRTCSPPARGRAAPPSPLEAVPVDAQPALARDVRGEVGGKP